MGNTVNIDPDVIDAKWAIAFGNYLLSPERRERFERSSVNNSLSLDERLATVGDWDIANFKQMLREQQSAAV